MPVIDWSCLRSVDSHLCLAMPLSLDSLGLAYEHVYLFSYVGSYIREEGAEKRQFPDGAAIGFPAHLHG